MESSTLKSKKALLLDMNNTFMFGEDRFGVDEDYSIHYTEIGGRLSKDIINRLITNVFSYLDERYPNQNYRHNFPSVDDAVSKVTHLSLPTDEVNNIIETFAFHEHGYIPDAYIDVLFQLKSKFVLSAVIDIWSPKERWLKTFKEKGIMDCFSTISFSSDHGMVKPSPKPFELIVNRLGIAKEDCLVIGDSVRRDLGGALSAGIDCVLVGGAYDQKALACYPSLLRFYMDIT